MGDELNGSVSDKSTQDELLDEVVEEVIEDETAEEELEEESEETEEEESEEEESEEDEEEKDEEETEIEPEDELVFEAVPKRQEILKKYPEFAKDFPGVFKAMYREQQYAEVFSTLSDAKDARTRLNGFEQLESSIFSGDLSLTLNQVKQNDPAAFNKITENYLSHLSKVDNSAFLNTISRVVKHALASAHAKGKETNDDQLQIAAELLHKFIYNTPEISVIKPTENQSTPEQNQFRNEQIEFRKQLLMNNTKEVGSRVTNIVRSLIDRSIDPKEQMSPYIKNKAVDDAMNAVNDALGTDTRFRSILDKLWQQSIQDNYSERSKLKIRNALVTRAKADLNSIISKIRSEALRGTVKKTKKNSSEPLPRQKSAGSSKTSDKTPPKNMKTLDYLMQD